VAPSQLAWLDYSEQERRRALDVISLFQEQGTIDELGIGSVRDSLADRFFPGTSTVQTRAAYFFFVPWIYLDLERRRVASADIQRRARVSEIRLIESLKEARDWNGLIGSQAGKNLSRLPSNIYWNGLYLWGLRPFPGSQPEYHRSLDGFYRSMRLARHEEEVGAEVPSPNWHPAIPPPPDSFPEVATFKLRKGDAEFLREKIMYRQTGTLLAWLAEHSKASTDEMFVWNHPLAAKFPEPFRTELVHARRFSEVIEGSALLYNLMLAQAADLEGLVEQYDNRLFDWAEATRAELPDLRNWDRAGFRALVGRRAKDSAWQFIDTWLDLATDPAFLRAVARNKGGRELIRAREAFLKGSRARLGNRRALSDWNGQSYAASLDYRWGRAEALLNDIQRGRRQHA
jgi:hypothetical protein